MADNRDKIIERIKKLLALANDDSNTNECITAALKAQELIAQYNVEEYELGEKSKDKIEEIMSDRKSVV